MLGLNERNDTSMPDVVVFNIVIPCTDNSTGFVHSPDKFDDWLLDTVDKFGGISVLGIGMLGLWYDEALPSEANPIEDHSNWYKIGTESKRVEELRCHVEETALFFGQKCIYFERTGEAEFVWARSNDSQYLG
jgi:hypothetical protein